MKHYNLWHSLIFRWSHWFPCVRPWQGRLQNSQSVIPVLPRWGFPPFFLTALIGHLAGCICCKTDFPLNQQKHRATAPQITREASCTELGEEEVSSKTKFVFADRHHICIKLLKLSHFQQWTDAVSSFLSVARLLSVTHLRHDASVVHATTTHAFVSFTDSFTVSHQDRLDVTLDYAHPSPEWLYCTLNASKVKGSAAALFCGKTGLAFPNLVSSQRFCWEAIL